MSYYSDIELLKKELSKFLKHADSVVVVCDTNTVEYCYPLLAEMPQLKDAPIIEIEPGEASKCIEFAEHLWREFLDLNLSRKSLVINLGGGVVGDLGGFCASTYKRGIPFIHIPTTNLAMTDAALGGKTGINLGFTKNVIGTFSLPLSTLICPVFLNTLPKAEMVDGFAESIKHALIADSEFWEVLSSSWSPELDDIPNTAWIRRSAEIKSEIVSQDPLENGLRTILNFGHTIGHAIEAVCLEEENKISHGLAIIMGMIAEMHLSVIKGICNEEAVIFPIKKLDSWYKPVWKGWMTADRLIDFIMKDKKNSHGVIKMSLLRAIGEYPVITEINPEEIVRAIEKAKVASA